MRRFMILCAAFSLMFTFAYGLNFDSADSLGISSSLSLSVLPQEPLEPQEPQEPSLPTVDDSLLEVVPSSFDSCPEILSSLYLIYDKLILVVDFFNLYTFTILPFTFAFFICWNIAKWCRHTFFNV